MAVKNIITGQRVKPGKLELAQRLREEMTESERMLWDRLRANRLHGFHFRCQQVIDEFIVDFYCHAAGLVVEVDGEVHQKQAEYDAERDRALAARGLHILRIRNEEVKQNLSDVLDRITDEIAKRSQAQSSQEEITPSL
jgi:very-short-patch-repair endonuclease